VEANKPTEYIYQSFFHQQLVKKTMIIIKMHGAYVKIIEAQQTRLCNSYKNTKLQLLKTIAAIWFNISWRKKLW